MRLQDSSPWGGFFGKSNRGFLFHVISEGLIQLKIAPLSFWVQYLCPYLTSHFPLLLGRSHLWTLRVWQRYNWAEVFFPIPQSSQINIIFAPEESFLSWDASDIRVHCHSSSPSELCGLKWANFIFLRHLYMHLQGLLSFFPRQASQAVCSHWQRSSNASWKGNCVMPGLICIKP